MSYKYPYERRTHTRIIINGTLRYSIVGSEISSTAKIRNVSVGGINFISEDSIPTDSLILVSFGNSDRAFKYTYQVLRSRKLKNGLIEIAAKMVSKDFQKQGADK